MIAGSFRNERHVQNAYQTRREVGAMSTLTPRALRPWDLEDEIAALATRARAGLPELLTIVGQPGAGKSTFARDIAQRYDGALVSQDNFLYESYRRRGDRLFDKYDDVSLGR